MCFYSYVIHFRLHSKGGIVTEQDFYNKFMIVEDDFRTWKTHFIIFGMMSACLLYFVHTLSQELVVWIESMSNSSCSGCLVQFSNLWKVLSYRLSYQTGCLIYIFYTITKTPYFLKHLSIDIYVRTMSCELYFVWFLCMFVFKQYTFNVLVFGKIFIYSL